MTKIELVELKKTYPGSHQPVLNHLSLEIHSGELVALLGPSGSGKSTILKLITGLENPDEGQILFDGKSILPVAPNKRGAILMFQKAYLFPFLNVEENIGFGLKVQGVHPETIRTEVKKMLNLIGLPGVENRKPSQLSGGEQQRIALARALILQPKSMLLDEPLSSLDTEVRVNLQEAIRRIQQELGITTILVTHDLNEAMGMSDRTALLINGQVAAIDQPMKLFTKPPTQSSARFVGVSTFFKGNLANGVLTTDFGKLSVNTNGHHAESALFAIRPEHIRVQTEPEINTLQGVVTDCMYRGEYIEYQVEIQSLTIRARVPMPAPVIPHGENIYVYFPPEKLFEVSQK
jgi:ABC-type Fe3+/spermidine/putrescine transport system ATPase subunit